MTPASLTAWMTRLGYNKVQAAEALGIARSTLDRYLAGSVNIPKYIELACEAHVSRQVMRDFLPFGDNGEPLGKGLADLLQNYRPKDK